MRFFIVIGLLPALAAQTLPQITSRLADEAARFYQLAPQLVSQETYIQRTAARPGMPWRTREIVSEYSFGTLAAAPGTIHEFRQVITVDGQPPASAAAARHSLALGLSGAGDEAKKRRLEEFQKYGLRETAVDFGPLLLLFTPHQVSHYRFALDGETRIGADAVKIVSYAQDSGDSRMLVVQGRRALHPTVQGAIYARIPDGLPLRITLVTERKAGSDLLRDEATVDYAPSAQGCLVPAAVTHRAYTGKQLTVEDDFHYGPFRKLAPER